MISIDLETHRIDRAQLAPKPVCAQWARMEGPKDPIYGVRVELWRDAPLARLLESELLGQNIAYDLAVVCEYRPDLLPAVFRAYDEGRVRSIDLDQQLLDIAAGSFERHEKSTGYSLEAIAGRYGLEKHGDDPWRLRYAELESVPIASWPESALAYCRADVEVPLKVRDAQVEQDQRWAAHWGSPILHDGPAQARAAFALHLMSCWGVRTSRERTERFWWRTERYRNRLLAFLQRKGLVRADGTRNTKKARALMLASCPPALLKRTKPSTRFPQGQVQLDDDAAELSGDRTLQAYSRFVSATALLARIADLREGYDLPLQCSYKALRETGRTSCTKPRGALKGDQRQNPPRAKGARECYEPRPGCVFLDADISAGEMHTLAQVQLWQFGKSKLAELLLSGTDPHLWFGAMTIGVPYDEAVRRKKEHELKKARQRAKPANFGYPGGMGPEKFVLYSRAQFGVTFTIEEAARIRSQWIAALEMQQYFSWIDSLGSTVKQFVSGRWRGGTSYTSRANGFFQALLADGAKAAMWAVTRECYADPSSALYGYRPWCFAHDQLLLEGPEEGSHEAAERLGAVMTAEFNRYVPDVPTRAEGFVTRYWSKDAEPVRENGKLIPWIPT